MSEIGLAVVTMVFALVMVRWRKARLRSTKLGGLEQSEGVSMLAMTEMISDLSLTLPGTGELVTAPQSYPDRGHVWASPCGKRVYIN